MLTFFFSPSSSSMAPHIALYEVEADFTPKLISLLRKENRSADYLAINPEGKVPTLITEAGAKLTEVAAILFYLAHRYPDRRLMPDDLEAQAQVISWMSYTAATLHPARGKGEEAAMAIFKVADARLGDRQWAVGDQYSIADIHLFRLYWRFKGSFNPPREAFPHLSAHHDRMMTRPAVQRTIEVEDKADAAPH